MKTILFFYLPFTIFLSITKSYAQCDFSGDTLNVAEVLTSPANCPGSGSITVNNVTGGGGIYVYEIIDGPVVRIIQSQNVFNALPKGEYIVRVNGCNGDIVDKTVTVSGNYTDMWVELWEGSLHKVSGLTCGATNNGVYKLSKPSLTFGSGPFRIQFSTTPVFTSVPYQPGNDSALFTGLNQSTTYYVRVTDACNNFVTFDFVTPATTNVIPLSVPTLSFQRLPFVSDCQGREAIQITVRDSATGSIYDGVTTYTNKVFWGNLLSPYLRIRIEDRIDGTIYADRNLAVSKFTDRYELGQNYDFNGETGLASPGIGLDLVTRNSVNYFLSDVYSTLFFPANAPLKITIYFPGGNHCGIIIPAYNKTFNYNMGQQSRPVPDITSVTANCSGSSSFFRVDFNRSSIGDVITLIKPLPAYNILTSSSFFTGSSSFTVVNYTPLILGETYRILVTDACGHKDSMDIMYNPSATPVPPPAVSLDYKVSLKCPANPADSIYNIVVEALPAGYLLTGVAINGISATITSIANWKGTGKTVNQINRLLPPGTYTCNINWINSCNSGTVSKNITISPVGSPPSYKADLLFSLYTQAATCSKDGYNSIEITGYLKNINTGYKLNNLRLVSGPNAYVYPINEKNGNRLEGPGQTMVMATQISGDSTYLNAPLPGLRIDRGKEGLYTFSIDIRCQDGTLVETITKSFNVAVTTPVAIYRPDLKYSNALMCGASSSELYINMNTLGGKRPYRYEYKLQSDISFQQTGNSGADSTVVISPAPAAGTVYDIRVTDGCGISSSGKVTVSTFTGQFFIYSYPSDCYNNPFNLRVGTSWIRGAYYTWKRNGLVVAQGYNIPYVNLTGVTVDDITVDVNLYNCYSGFGERQIVSPNPCSVVVLPVNSLALNGKRQTAFNVQLNWKSVNELKSIRYFELEKSIDGMQFTKIYRRWAVEKPGEYSYVYDDTETAQLVFYRLRMVSFDEKEFLTPIIKIENKKVNRPQISISPNPAREFIILSLYTDQTKLYKAKIYSGLGLLIKEVSIAPEEMGAKKINISSLPKGTYFVSIIDNWEVVTTGKFIKL